jgi:hypothetical protein
MNAEQYVTERNLTYRLPTGIAEDVPGGGEPGFASPGAVCDEHLAVVGACHLPLHSGRASGQGARYWAQH